MSKLLISFQTLDIFPESAHFEAKIDSKFPFKISKMNMNELLQQKEVNSDERLIELEKSSLYIIEFTDLDITKDFHLTLESKSAHPNLTFNLAKDSIFDQYFAMESSSVDHMAYFLWIHPPVNAIDFDIKPFSLKFIKKFRENSDLFIIGHRGMGSEDCNYIKSLNHINENSIAAFQKAHEMKLPAVELDIQLSKDDQFIIHHNFTLKIDSVDGKGILDVKAKDPSLSKDVLNLSNNLSFSEIRNLLNYHPDIISDNDRVPRLSDVFNRTSCELGIDIEVKYPKMTPVDIFKKCDNHLENIDNLQPCLYFGNINKVVDRIGRELVDNKAKLENRPILFSCFNADLCYVMKQKYPKLQVLFISLNGEDNEGCLDPRHSSWKGACSWVKFANLDGLVIPYRSLALYDDDELDEFTNILIAYEKPCFVYGDQLCLPESQDKICKLGMSGMFLDDVETYMKECWKYNNNELHNIH